MKSFFLDSNVLSETWKPVPNAVVFDWLGRAEWFLPVPVVAEIQEGAEATASVARRDQINARLDEFLREHAALVINWDMETARVWGRLKHSREVKRQP